MFFIESALAMNLKVSRIQNIHELEPEKDLWNDLVAQNSTNSAFLLWEWVSSWYENRCSTENIYLLKITDSSCEKVVGYAPLFLKTKRCLGLKLRELAFAGSDSICSEYLDFIIKAGTENLVIKAIFEYLMNYRNEWDCLKLTDLLPDSSVYTHRRDFPNGYNLNLSIGNSRLCFYKPLPSSWNELIKSLSKKKRENMKRKERRLKNNFHQIEFGKVASDENQLNLVMQKLMNFHQDRWARDGIYGIFSSDKMREFYLAVAQRMARHNLLSLYYLKINGSFVAVRYGLRYNNKLYSYSSGFDLAYSRFAIGSVLLNRIIEECTCLGIEEYDFLRGQSSYKFEFKPEQRQTYYIEFRQKKLKILLWFKLSRGLAGSKKCIRQLFPQAARKRIGSWLNKNKSRRRLAE